MARCGTNNRLQVKETPIPSPTFWAAMFPDDRYEPAQNFKNCAGHEQRNTNQAPDYSPPGKAG
jgi:hypothetical protein